MDPYNISLHINRPALNEASGILVDVTNNTSGNAFPALNLRLQKQNGSIRGSIDNALDTINVGVETGGLPEPMAGAALTGFANIMLNWIEGDASPHGIFIINSAAHTGKGQEYVLDALKKIRPYQHGQEYDGFYTADEFVQAARNVIASDAGKTNDVVMDLLERGVKAMKDSADMHKTKFAYHNHVIVDGGNAAAFEAELKDRVGKMDRAETLLTAANELAPPELKTIGAPKLGTVFGGVTIGQAINDSLSGAKYTNDLLKKADMCFEGTYKQHLQTQQHQL